MIAMIAMVAMVAVIAFCSSWVVGVGVGETGAVPVCSP